jgi:hypothetical protein
MFENSLFLVVAYTMWCFKPHLLPMSPISAHCLRVGGNVGLPVDKYLDHNLDGKNMKNPFKVGSKP